MAVSAIVLVPSARVITHQPRYHDPPPQDSSTSDIIRADENSERSSRSSRDLRRGSPGIVAGQSRRAGGNGGAGARRRKK